MFWNSATSVYNTPGWRVALGDPGSSICEIIGRFSIENHHFTGAILHYLSIFTRKFHKKLAFNLQFAVLISVGEARSVAVAGRATCKHSSFVMRKSSFLMHSFSLSIKISWSLLTDTAALGEPLNTRNTRETHRHATSSERRKSRCAGGAAAAYWIDGFCIKIDGLCIKSMDFALRLMDFDGSRRRPARTCTGWFR